MKIPLYIDFDRVLFDTDTLKNALCDFFESKGYSGEQVKESYRQAGLDRMYTPEKHIAVLQEMQPKVAVDTNAVIAEAYNQLSDLGYPGTAHFLQSLNRKAYTICLLTLGNPQFQKAKVDKMNISQYFDSFHWCKEEKWDYLKRLHQPNDRFVSIDDRGDAITVISEQFPNSFGIFKDLYNEYPHYQAARSVRVTNFEEILALALPDPYPALKDPALSAPADQD